MAAESIESPDISDEPTPLRVVLEIEPPADVSCPVVNRTPDASSITQTLTSATEEQTCQNEVMVVDGTTPRTEYLSTTVDSSCVCATLSQFECVYDLEGVQDGSLRIAISVLDRTLLGEIVSALGETGATVDVRRISRVNRSETMELDTTEITDKQREAVELAVELGYYDRPRDADLQELADRLGISKSAVSQRLNAVESTLVQSLVSSCGNA